MYQIGKGLGALSIFGLLRVIRAHLPIPVSDIDTTRLYRS